MLLPTGFITSGPGPELAWNSSQAAHSQIQPEKPFKTPKPLASSWHQPVLLTEVLGLMNLDRGAVLVDCTFGDGGHSIAFLAQSGSGSRVWGIDRDADGLARARTRLQIGKLEERCCLVHSSFSNLKALASGWDLGSCDNVLLDLGFSSGQVDDPVRGFAFALAGPLDMRMDRSQDLTAADIVNGWSEDELLELLGTLHEVPHARRITAELVARRPFQSTQDLAEAVARAVPLQPKRHLHPATRTFQALRIAVNDELGQLTAVLPQALDLLAPKGRLLVISFHSQEDGIVKRFFHKHGRKRARNKYARSQCERELNLSILTKRPVRPGEQEIRDNPRSRSARLRVAEKIGERLRLERAEPDNCEVGNGTGGAD